MAGELATQVSESLSFAKKMPMLLKATSDDDNPTPGYLFQEINNITYECLSSCGLLLNFLIARLKKQSPVVKYKVLKILSYLSANGHSEFRSGLRHKADVVRETVSFTGPIDHLRGDALNQRVRRTASELIEVLFNVECSGESIVSAMAGPTGRKMEGFGNSPLQPSKKKTWFESMKNLASVLPDSAGLHKNKIEKEKAFIGPTGMLTENPQTGSTDRSVQFTYCPNLSNSGVAFGAFLDSEDSRQSLEDKECALKSEDALSTEIHLVNEITSEGGIRALPTKEALSQFTKRCATLNIDKILDALNNRLDEPVTEVQLKSLHVMEHLLKTGLHNVAGRMQHHCTNLEEISRNDSGNMTSKARKILSIIAARTRQQEITRDFPRPTLRDSFLQRDDQTKELLNIETATGTSKSSFCGQEEQVVTDLFHGMNLLSENHHGKNDSPSSISAVNSKLASDDLFSVNEERKKQQLANDHWTDIFDPLYVHEQYNQPCAKLNSGFPQDSQLAADCGSNSLLVQTVTTASFSSNNYCNHSSNLAIITPRLTGFCGPSMGAVESVTTSTSVHGARPQAHLLPQQLRPSHPPHGDLPSNSVYHSFHSQSPSGTSTIPLRLPKPSTQKSDFDFIGRSGKADAFSFVEDEMKASK